MAYRGPRKRGKKVFRAIVLILLAAILAALVAFFWYLPRYAIQQHERTITPANDGTVTVMSSNLRYIAPTDLGTQSWFYRAELIMADLESQSPAIIGFQEATRWHYKYLVESLPQYDSVITYRDNSIVAEGCPIFYHKDLFTLVDKGSFWLSETPEVMSKDWGSSHYRVCSYVILEDKQSGQQFVVFNTHLDHVSDEARIKGIEVVLDKIEAFGSLPAVIMGDFNAKENSKTYENVTQYFVDARYAAAETTDSATYQNWGNMDNARRIDYFMVSPNGMNVLRYNVLNHTHDGVFASDHWPLVLTVSFD